MNSRERVFSLLDSQPPDHLPLMPIPMMFAAHHIGNIWKVCLPFDHHLMIEAQIRKAPDCWAVLQYFGDQPYALNEGHARLADKRSGI